MSRPAHIDWSTWVHMTYDERHAVDPVNWPIAVPYKFQNESQTEGEDDMGTEFNIKAEIKTGGKGSLQCHAMRCTEPRAGWAVGDCWDRGDVQVPLCDKHLKIARISFDLDAVPGSHGLDGSGWQPPLVVQSANHESVEVERPNALVPVQIQAELVLEANEARDVLSMAKDLTINTQASLQFAADSLAEVKGILKRLEAKRLEATRPLNEALKAIRGWFKPAEDYYGAAEKELKLRIGEADKRQAEENRAALALAAERAAEGRVDENGDDFVDDPVFAAVANVRHTTNVAGISTRKVMKFEITDSAAVPRPFCLPSDQLIKRAIDAGVENIPGVRIFEDVQVISRSAVPS